MGSVSKTQSFSDERMQLLDKLQGLLEEQIELAHQGNIKDVESLGGKADCLVKQIVQSKILEQDGYGERRERLRELYQQLYLALTSHKASLSEDMKRVRQGKKTIAAYRRNI